MSDVEKLLMCKTKQCAELKRQKEELEQDNEFLKKCLAMALGQRTIVITDEYLKHDAPAFVLEPNLNNDKIIKLKRRGR